MSFDHLHSQIDEEQQRLDLIDDLDDEAIAEQTSEAFFKKLDDYQTRVNEADFPDELKEEQAELTLTLLKEVSPEGIEEAHTKLEEHLEAFNASLDELENTNFLIVKDGDSLSKIARDQLGIDPQTELPKLLAAVQVIQTYRMEHGTKPVITEDGSLNWESMETGEDLIYPGEYLDLSIFQSVEYNETTNTYLEIQKEVAEEQREEIKEEIRAEVRESVEGSVAGSVEGSGSVESAGSIEISDPELDIIIDELEAKDELPNLDELDAEIAMRMAEDLDDYEGGHEGLLHFSNADEFQEFVASLETDEEREELMEHIIGNLDIEPPLTEQQNMRLEQVELLTHLYSTLVIELGEQSKTWAQELASLSVEQEQIMTALSTYEATLATDLPAAAEAIKADPNATLESIMPERISKLRSMEDSISGLAQWGLGLWSNEIVEIDLSDPKSIEDLNKQRFAIMSFVRVTKNYDAARAIAEETLDEEFTAAMEALSPERQAALRSEAREDISSQVESMRDQWIEEGLTDEQIDTFEEVLIEEEATRLIKSEAVKLHFDPSQLSGEKKQIWDIYQDAFDVKEDFFNLTDESWDTIKREILINAPLIILSGGTASLIRAGVSRGTIAVAARIGINATNALKASRALRIASSGAGLLVEGAAFEYSHSTLAYGLGLEDHHILELSAYEQVERVLWSTAALGLFHGVGSGIQKGAQRSAVKAASREMGVTSTTILSKEAEAVLLAEAAKISAGPVRTVVQAAIAVNAEAGAMLILAAAQEGVYKGDLSEFFEHFGEHVFHSYTAVLSLKAGGAVASPIQGKLKSSYDKFRANKKEKRGPEGENLRTIEAPRQITDRTALAKEKSAETKKENEKIKIEIEEGIEIIDRRTEKSKEPEKSLFDHPVAEQSRWERMGIQAHRAKKGLREAWDALDILGSKLKQEKAEKPEAESTKEAEKVLEQSKKEYSEANQTNRMAELISSAHELGKWATGKGRELSSRSADRALEAIGGIKSKLSELTVDGIVGGVEFVLKIESAIVTRKKQAEAYRREQAELRKAEELKAAEKREAERREAEEYRKLQEDFHRELKRAERLNKEADQSRQEHLAKERLQAKEVEGLYKRAEQNGVESNWLKERIRSGEPLKGQFNELAWTHRTDIQTLGKILESGNLRSNKDRGVEFMLGSGTGYGDVQIIAKNSVMELPAAREIYGDAVPGQANMHYFFKNTAEANGMGVREYSRNYGEHTSNRADNIATNTPYLSIGREVSLQHIEAVMFPTHVREHPQFAEIKRQLEGQGIKVIEVQTAPSVLEYCGGSLVYYDMMNPATQRQIEVEINKKYPDNRRIEDKLAQYLFDSGRAPEYKSLDSMRWDVSKINMDAGMMRSPMHGGQYNTYTSQKSHRTEQNAYFEHVADRPGNRRRDLELMTFADSLSGTQNYGVIREVLRRKLESESIFELCSVPEGNFNLLQKSIDSIQQAPRDPAVRRILSEEMTRIYTQTLAAAA